MAGPDDSTRGAVEAVLAVRAENLADPMRTRGVVNASSQVSSLATLDVVVLGSRAPDLRKRQELGQVGRAGATPRNGRQAGLWG